MIKYGLLIGVLAVMYVCVTTSTACRLDYKPVCGTDGKTYINSCELMQHKQFNPKLKLAHTGRCKVSFLSPVHDIMKRSTNECKYGAKKVCGTNGVTYENPCLMNHAGNKTHHVKLSHFGPCNDTTMAKEVMDNKSGIVRHAQNKSETEIFNNSKNVHTQNSSEVQNLEMAPNAQKQNRTEAKDLQQSKDQKQTTSETENPSIELSCPACGLELHEICGNDGVTYGNPCLLTCAARLNSTLDVHFEGRCEGGKLIVQARKAHEVQEDTSTDVKNSTQNMQNATNADKQTKTDGKVRKQRDLQIRSELLCACPKNLHKVCSTDGVTYFNLCLLKCAAINNINIQFKHDGPCDAHDGKMNNTQETDNEEVLAENLNTTAQAKGNAQTEVSQNGTQTENPKNASLTGLPVEDTKNNTKELEQHDGLVGTNNSSCSCPTNNFPVCGTNGVTYDNLCFLKCAAISDETIEVKSEGTCDDKGNVRKVRQVGIRNNKIKCTCDAHIRYSANVYVRRMCGCPMI